MLNLHGFVMHEFISKATKQAELLGDTLPEVERRDIECRGCDVALRHNRPAIRPAVPAVVEGTRNLRSHAGKQHSRPAI